ncbi:MAG: bifunctional diaminohydroxyphosphoribosylaminopyrimidine deaminase/5-amino-6-(5-phosphoribosylamino)uracil reductase RibD [Candidatus Eisenbacteria bacterium]
MALRHGAVCLKGRPAIARTGDDQRHMERALKLAERGRGRTRPNPIVGAVLVRGGRVVGEGWHCAAGEDHAEVVALKLAGLRARGATLYVTLEPCAHRGRTPPCTEALIAAGVRRCVVALRDPHAIVNGRGLSALRRAGVKVELGLLADEARAQLAGYRLAHTVSRPRVVWKIAATLDGGTADRQGRSRWITGPEARRAGHLLRAASDAVLIGAGTALADDPRLTARTGRGTRVERDAPQPLRIVCDTRLRLPLTLRLFSPSMAAGTVVACGRRAPLARRRRLEARGVRVWPLAETAAGVAPAALARRLAAEGCHEVLMESGGVLGASWLGAGLVDRLVLFTAPSILGPSLRWSERLASRALDRKIAGSFTSVRRLGADLMLSFDLEGGNVHRAG